MRASGIATVSRSSWSQQVHLHAQVPQRLGEGVVLLLGPLHPQHVVEEVLVLVGRGQPLQLQVRAVQDRLSQAADLRVHVQGHRRPSRRPHGGPPCAASPGRREGQGPDTAGCRRACAAVREWLAGTGDLTREGAPWPHTSAPTGSDSRRPRSRPTSGGVPLPERLHRALRGDHRRLAARVRRPDRRVQRPTRPAADPRQLRGVDGGLSFGDRLMDLFLARQRPLRRDERRGLHRALRDRRAVRRRRGVPVRHRHRHLHHHGHADRRHRQRHRPGRQAVRHAAAPS